MSIVSRQTAPKHRVLRTFTTPSRVSSWTRRERELDGLDRQLVVHQVRGEDEGVVGHGWDRLRRRRRRRRR